MMPYVTTKETTFYGRKETRCDLERFAKDFAEAFTKLTGTAVTPVPREAESCDRPDEYQAFMIGTDRLDLRSNSYTLKGRVVFYLNAPDIKWGDWSTYDPAQKTVDATVNPDGRKIETIAKDINKRVVEANKPALAARRAYAAQQQAMRDGIVKQADDLKRDLPALSVRLDKDAQRASLYLSTPYISGTLMSDGSVSLERLGSVSGETFRKIVAVLQGAKEENA